MKDRPVFRFTVWDAIPASSGVAIFVLILWTFTCFDALSWPVCVGAFGVVMASYCWNLQCISHNFVHNPFFANAWLNRVFGLIETLAIGVPQVLYHHYHLNHHFGDNDKKGPSGTTKDWSSIYRYGKNDEPEGFWRYCLLSFFRVEVRPVVEVVVRHGREDVSRLVTESLFLAGFWFLMAFLNWRYFVLFYLPSYYLGWVLSYAEGYLEHFGAKPGNPFANSVSSYNRIYNWFWFNNGFHQEHHWDPKTHWTQMPQLHESIRGQLHANGTPMLKGPHFLAWFERRWQAQPAEAEARPRPRSAA